MRTLLATMLLLASSSALAGDTYAFPRGIIGTGDSTAALVQKAGQPSRIVQLQNKFGGAVGERWEYYLRDGKQVNFTISGGKVVAVNDVN